MTETYQTFRLLDALPEPMVALNMAGNILYCNKAWREAPPSSWEKSVAFGDNYISAITKASKHWLSSSGDVVIEFAAVLYGIKDGFELEFQFPKNEWSSILVNRITDDGLQTILIRHQTVTKQKNIALQYVKLNQAVEQSPAMFVITDPDGKIEYANPRFCHVTGYDTTEVIGKNPRFLKSGKMSQKDYEHLWKTISSGNEWRGEFYNVKKNGDYYWEQAAISPIIDEKGKTINYLAVKEDITIQKQLELQLFREKSFIDSVLENLRDIFIIIKDGKITRWNKSTETVTQYSPEKIAEMKPADFIVDDQRYLIDEALRWVNRDSFCTFELDVLTKSDERIPFEFTLSVVKDPDGVEEGICAIGRNVKRRKTQEEMLVQSEKKYRTLFEESRDVIYISSATGKLLDINPAGVALLGYESKAALLDVNIAEDLFTDPLDRARLVTELDKNGYVKDYEVTLKRKDGKKLMVQISASTVLNDSDKPKAYRGIIRDITEKTQLQQQLLHTQKLEAIGTLAGGIAHDFNNILGAILGYADLLKMDVPENSTEQYNLDQIIQAGMRASQLVKQILTFSHKAEQKFTEVRIAGIIDEVVKLIRATLPSSIEIKTDVANDRDMVFADASQMHQLLMNLCTNAYHAMQENGCGLLNITSESFATDVEHQVNGFILSPGKYVKISVSDTGRGIKPNILKHIFDPFFTTKPVGQGTGMGLSVVHGIVKSHSGEISVSSEVDKGSVFSIYLPLINQSAQNEEAVREIATSGAERILFIDDEEMLVNISKQLLELLGYSVAGFTNPMEALEKFRENSGDFDLIITDLTMPKTNIEDLVREFHETREDIPVILTTGYNNTFTDEKAEAIGIAAFLRKPLKTNELTRAIRLVLETNREVTKPR